jgi:H+/Cl- antiporter ClcA
MSRQQYAFIVGVLLVWLAWDAGWVIFAAVAAGLIGIAIVRALEGDLDLGEIVDKFRSSSDKSS